MASAGKEYREELEELTEKETKLRARTRTLAARRGSPHLSEDANTRGRAEQ